MQDHQDLLEQARPYCDPSTGEVLQRVPEELMRELRTAKLARGVPRCRNRNTQTFATWFVFLNEEIRVRVLAQVRQANQKRPRSQKPAQNTPENAAGQPTRPAGQVAAAPPAGNQPPAAKVPVKRGLGEFRRTRRSTP